MSIERKCIPPYLFNLIVRLLDDGGLNSVGLVDGMDFELDDLAHEDMRISYRDGLGMIDNAYRISADEQLGLRVAREVNIADWGMLGYAVASCSNLGESLVVGQRYNRAATRLTDNRVDINDEAFCFESAPLYASGSGKRFLVEEDLGGVVGMLHRYLGDQASPREVHFTYAAPSYLTQYEEHFGCPLKFEQTSNRIIWDIADMQQPMPLRNPAATEMAVRHCEQLILEDQDRGTLIDKVRSTLVQSPGRYPSICEIAEKFNMSESRLRRARKSLGSSYQQILNDVRKKLAIEYLTTSNLKLEETAYLLGYSDLSNVRRAFRGWTGSPPLDYRRGKR